MARVLFPTGFFPYPLTGKPIALGKVYIGDVDTDPTVLGNRVNVTIVKEDGTEVVIAPASQPFELNNGGMFTYNGSVVQFRVSGNFAMEVQDSSEVQQYYFPDVQAGDSVETSNIQLSATTKPSTVAGVGQVYSKTVSGIVELFYLDSSGNEVQITTGGAINVSLGTAPVSAASFTATEQVQGGYFLGEVAELTISGGVLSIDWQAASYFIYTNTETHTIEFSNIPAIGDGIGQTIMLIIKNGGNFGFSLDPGTGYTVKRRSIDNFATGLTTDGLDYLICTVYQEGAVAVVPLYNFVDN